MIFGISCLEKFLHSVRTRNDAKFLISQTRQERIENFWSPTKTWERIQNSWSSKEHMQVRPESEILIPQSTHGGALWIFDLTHYRIPWYFWAPKNIVPRWIRISDHPNNLREKKSCFLWAQSSNKSEVKVNKGFDWIWLFHHISFIQFPALHLM